MTDKNMTIDSAYRELQKIVDEFEHGDLDLEKSLPQFKHGLELASFLKDKLGELKVEVEEIKSKFEQA